MTSASFPNLQAFYRARYKLLKPGWEESLTLYSRTVSHFVQPQRRLLDIGCGHSDFLREIYARTPHTYGIDPDAESLARNTIVRYLTVGSADQLPFEGGSFDLVVSSWVLEHLEQPEQTFQEIYRVLKPGGRVICLTPNTWNNNVWLIRLIPNSLHRFLVRRLYKRQEQDTYPVRYAINSPRKIQHVLGSLGFRKDQVMLNGDPTYISFDEPLFFLACLLEAMLNLSCFHFARVHIISVYHKPLESQERLGQMEERSASTPSGPSAERDDEQGTVERLKGRSMQEKPSIHPPVMTDYGKARNTITAVCLGLSVLLLPFCVLSTGYETGPSIMWRIVSDALRSGILTINDGTGFFAILFIFPLSVWGFVFLMLSLANYWRKKPSAKKSTITWASALLGITLLLMVFLLVISHDPPCVEQSYNGNGVCSLPIRPGVEVSRPDFR